MNKPDKYLRVKREILKDTYTLGALFLVSGNAEVQVCYTLEDTVRPAGVKVQKETAIPPGTYQMRLSHSNRFKKILPEILNVPMFTGVRMHGGNTYKNTEGCILLGFARNKSQGQISNCAPAVAEVMRIIGTGVTTLVVE